MNEEMRIQPERVIQAYKALKIPPIQKEWLVFDGDNQVCGACALTAVAIHDGVAPIEHDLSEKISTTLNMRRSYMVGFTSGFDGEPNAFDSSLSWLGYEDGTACCRAIWSESGELLI